MPSAKTSQEGMQPQMQFVRLLTEASFGVAGSVFMETQRSALHGKALAETAVLRLLKLGGPVCTEYHMLVVECQHTAKGNLPCHVVKVHSNHRVAAAKKAVRRIEQRVRELSTGSEEEIEQLCVLMERMSLTASRSAEQIPRNEDRRSERSFPSGSTHKCYSRNVFDILGDPLTIRLGNGKPTFMSQVMGVLKTHRLDFDDIRIIILAGIDLDGAVGDWALLRSVSRTGRSFRTGCPMLENSAETALNTRKSGLGLTDSMLYISSDLLRALEQGFDAKVFAQVLGVQPRAMWFFDPGEEHLKSMNTQLPRKLPLLQLTNGDVEDEYFDQEVREFRRQKLRYSAATKHCGRGLTSSADEGDKDVDDTMGRVRKRFRKVEIDLSDDTKNEDRLIGPQLQWAEVEEAESKKRESPASPTLEEELPTNRRRRAPKSGRLCSKRGRCRAEDDEDDDDADSALAKRTRELLSDETTQRTVYRMLGAQFAGVRQEEHQQERREQQEEQKQTDKEEEEKEEEQKQLQDHNLQHVSQTAPHVPSMTMAF